MASATDIANWSASVGVPLCIGQAYNAQYGRLPNSTDELVAWGNSTGRRNSAGTWACKAGDGVSTPPTRGAGESDAAFAGRLYRYVLDRDGVYSLLVADSRLDWVYSTATGITDPVKLHRLEQKSVDYYRTYGVPIPDSIFNANIAAERGTTTPPGTVTPPPGGTTPPPPGTTPPDDVTTPPDDGTTPPVPFNPADWIKANPLLAAGLGLVAFMLFGKGRR